MKDHIFMLFCFQTTTTSYVICRAEHQIHACIIVVTISLVQIKTVTMSKAWKLSLLTTMLFEIQMEIQDNVLKVCSYFLYYIITALVVLYNLLEILLVFFFEI